MVMRAVRGGGAGGLGSSGAGQDGTRSPMLTLQMVPRDYKICPSAWRCNHIWTFDSRALACWSVILGYALPTVPHSVRRRSDRAWSSPRSRSFSRISSQALDAPRPPLPYPLQSSPRRHSFSRISGSMLLVHPSLSPCSHPRAVALSHASQARCSSFTPPLPPPLPSLSRQRLFLHMLALHQPHE